MFLQEQERYIREQVGYGSSEWMAFYICRRKESFIFADQKKHVKPLMPYETFFAHNEAGDAKQKLIEATVNSYGLTISGTRAPNTICAVGTLERIYDKYGQEILDATIRLSAATWEGEVNSFSGNILMGIARIVDAYGEALKEDVFKEHVGKLSIKSIMASIRERNGRFCVIYS